MTPAERKRLRFVRRTIPGAREAECVIKNSELDALLDLLDRYEAALRRIAENHDTMCAHDGQWCTCHVAIARAALDGADATPPSDTEATSRRD